jgi:hypothetical protein
VKSLRKNRAGDIQWKSRRRKQPRSKYVASFFAVILLGTIMRA